MTKYIFITIACLMTFSLVAQPDRWQQRAEYGMEIDFDVEKHQYKGMQTLKYYNNSPDTLDRVFYHLYFNAFQPNSMMDVRSRTIADPDYRVGGRISKLGPDEIGYIKVKSLKQDGQAVQFETVGTILEVELTEPILPNSTATFVMDFDAQVPLQIRRSGRNNREGIDYSMAQWYPKMCEYDYQGWHANPYIGREFYGIWGDFDVKISIDKSYVVAASGYIQNPQEVGYGYEAEGMEVKKPAGEKLTWHFFAPNVHDFLWAADPDYTHTKYPAKDGTMLHFFYQKNENTEENWAALPAIMSEALAFINENFGQYPYKRYSFIQGGDGGMEYPMATLITGERRLPSLVGVSVHELMHSWYQMVLGSNESLYPWMDEGFTTYASNETMNYLRSKGLISGEAVENPQAGGMGGYVRLAQSGIEEPMTTHSDHYNRNGAYGAAAYTKGGVMLAQLKYILGEETFKRALLRYYNTWKFKHPNANDFIRVMEKESGLELDWYKEYFVFSTKSIDYAVGSIDIEDGKSTITLERIGLMPMPLDVLVTYEDGSKTLVNIPLRIMRGAKQETFEDGTYITAEDWAWTHPEYKLELDGVVTSVQIDPFRGMADVNEENNSK